MVLDQAAHTSALVISYPWPRINQWRAADVSLGGERILLREVTSRTRQCPRITRGLLR